MIKLVFYCFVALTVVVPWVIGMFVMIMVPVILWTS